VQGRARTGGEGLRVGGGCYAVVSLTVRLAVLCPLTVLGLTILLAIGLLAVGVLAVALLIILLTVLAIGLLLTVLCLLTVLRLLAGLLRLRTKTTETRVTLSDILRH